MSYREPEFLPWDGRRVPLTFVAGYLGAGKTTLLNHVLRTTDRPIAVIVNDVGEINIDARLIQNRNGDTIELSDGCVCCSSVDGFGAAFDTIRARETPPEHVVVELSGIAEPARMVPWGRSAGFTLDGVMTLVAADQFGELLERPDIALAIQEQIRAADVVALTKTDLVGAEQLGSVRERLQGISPGVPVVDAHDTTVPGLVLAMGGGRSGSRDAVTVPEPTLFDRHETHVVALANPTTRAEVDALLEELPGSVVRAKGIAAGADGERWAIQVVGRRREVTQLAPVEADAITPTDLVTISLPG